jgi:hypothetical protein
MGAYPASYPIIPAFGGTLSLNESGLVNTGLVERGA